MKYLFVQADTNDADYVSKFTEISDEDLAKLMPLFEAIKAFKRYKGKCKDGPAWEHNHNFPWGSGEYVPRKDLGEKTVWEIYPEYKEAIRIFVDQYWPYGEYGIHTIDNIKVFNVAGIEEII
jgi:hypothetical protein